MAKKKNTAIQTHEVIVLDESGSMKSMWDEVINGYNKHLDDGKKDGNDYLWSLLKFDSTKIDLVHDCIPIADVVELNRELYRPGASTPLYDAIAHAIRSAEAKHKEGQKVLVAIFTDGQENSSREIGIAELTALIKEKEAAGWAFVYLGVALDAWNQQSVFVGTHMATANNFASAGTKGLSASYGALSSVRSAYASGMTSVADLVTDDLRDSVRNSGTAASPSVSPVVNKKPLRKRVNAWGK